LTQFGGKDAKGGDKPGSVAVVARLLATPRLQYFKQNTELLFRLIKLFKIMQRVKFISWWTEIIEVFFLLSNIIFN